MSADMSIHSQWGVSEDTLRCFFSSTLGHEFEGYQCSERSGRFGLCDRHFEEVSNTDQVYVGSVSWLKAALTEDVDQFVPGTIQQISELLEDRPVVTDDLISAVDKAFDAPNDSIYDAPGDGTRAAVQEFLARNRDQRVFTVSW